MQTKTNLKTTGFPPLEANATLKTISSEDFASLGADRIAYAHSVTGAELNNWFPDALTAPSEGRFHLLMSAGGVPLVVSDSAESIGEWLDENDALLVQRH